MLSRLSEHPSIVRVFDLNVTTTVRGAQVPYLVLEWLEGDELERIIAARRKNRLPAFTEREATDLLRPVIDALALAHDERIAHRDVKPANIFIARTKNGVRVKMLDFGIAKAMQDGESATQMSTKTSSGFHAFSPQYGAPEQFRSKRYGATGPWTDIHALGLILTELTSGRPALYGDEMADFLEQGTAARRPTPRARGAEVSDAFEQLCERALALDPRERFQDANELRRALDALPSADAEPRRDLAELVSVPTDPSLALGPTDQYVGVPARRESAPEAPASGKTEHAEPIVATPPDAPTAAAARAATPCRRSAGCSSSIGPRRGPQVGRVRRGGRRPPRLRCVSRAQPQDRRRDLRRHRARCRRPHRHQPLRRRAREGALRGRVGEPRGVHDGRTARRERGPPAPDEEDPHGADVGGRRGSRGVPWPLPEVCARRAERPALDRAHAFEAGRSAQEFRRVHRGRQGRGRHGPVRARAPGPARRG